MCSYKPEALTVQCLLLLLRWHLQTTSIHASARRCFKQDAMRDHLRHCLESGKNIFILYYILYKECASGASTLLKGFNIIIVTCELTQAQCNAIECQMLSAIHPGMFNCSWKWSLISRARAHPGNPCDSLNQPATQLVQRLAALLTRTPGKRRLQQDRLPLRSACRQC